ncbi:MAG: transcriptional repressor LexA [Xanthomonadales bacterium]|nr:transcriptional repressor LexA [Xanthomonadales bacterium]
MAVPRLLGARPHFPPPDDLPGNAPCLLGGRVAADWLGLAYRRGYFPWPEPDWGILTWWHPDPRWVLSPEAIRLPRSFRRFLRGCRFLVSHDAAFPEVLAACAAPRPRSPGTWLVPALRAGYLELAREGLAHSVEVWDGERLVGGLFGVAVGSVFSGDSMFSRADHASKVALLYLCRRLAARGGRLVDCQTHSPHLERFGARPLPRADFVALLERAALEPDPLGGGAVLSAAARRRAARAGSARLGRRLELGLAAERIGTPETRGAGRGAGQMLSSRLGLPRLRGEGGQGVEQGQEPRLAVAEGLLQAQQGGAVGAARGGEIVAVPRQLGEDAQGLRGGHGIAVPLVQPPRLLEQGFGAGGIPEQAEQAGAPPPQLGEVPGAALGLGLEPALEAGKQRLRFAITPGPRERGGEQPERPLRLRGRRRALALPGQRRQGFPQPALGLGTVASGQGGLGGGDPWREPRRVVGGGGRGGSEQEGEEQRVHERLTKRSGVRDGPLPAILKGEDRHRLIPIILYGTVGVPLLPLAMRKLTGRQREILDYLREHLRTFGYPPTRAEIARRFGFRVAASAEEHLQALARKGAIALVPGSARGIRILAEEAESLEGGEEGVPLLGTVAAGEPILALEEAERGRLPLPEGLFGRKPDFLLRVRGESMREAGILDGDLVAVAKGSQAAHGELVVARLGEEATLKRLHRRGGETLLVPANAEFDPIPVTGREDLVIEGRVIGVIRVLAKTRA